jgi:(p)ppGpp synthase/HD superfamily hydrolase
MKPFATEIVALMATDTPFLLEKDRRRAHFLVSKIIQTGRHHLVIVQQKKMKEVMLDSSRIHAGQYRKKGKTPYMLHLLEVACILIDARIYDFKTLCAAMLHDTVEDTKNPDKKEAVRRLIQKKYGAMIAYIVHLLTKREGEDKDMQWRRMLDEPDLSILWRVLVIKYADRIHNARTFNDLPTAEDKDRKIKETLRWFPVIIKQRLDDCLSKLWKKRTLKNRSRLHLPDTLQNKLDAALDAYR